MAAGDGWSALAVLSSISSWMALCFPLEWCYSHSSSILANPRLKPPGLDPSCSGWVWFSVRLEYVNIFQDPGFVVVYDFNLMNFVIYTCNIKVWNLWNPCQGCEIIIFFRKCGTLANKHQYFENIPFIRINFVPIGNKQLLSRHSWHVLILI